MLMDWTVALCLVFLMHYIMAFSVTINEKIIKAISAISGSSAEEKEKAVENAKKQYLNGTTGGKDGTTDQTGEVGTGIEMFIIDDKDTVERAYKTLVGDEGDVNADEGYASNEDSYFYNRFIWGDYLRREDTSGEAGALYGRMLASNITNLVTLIIVFFLRDIVPFDGIAFLIGTAGALSLKQRKDKDQRREVRMQ